MPFTLFSIQHGYLTNINIEEKYLSYVQITYCFGPTKPLPCGALEILPIQRPMGYRAKYDNRWIDSIQIIKSQKICLEEMEELIHYGRPMKFVSNYTRSQVIKRAKDQILDTSQFCLIQMEREPKRSRPLIIQGTEEKQTSDLTENQREVDI